MAIALPRSAARATLASRFSAPLVPYVSLLPLDTPSVPPVPLTSCRVTLRRQLKRRRRAYTPHQRQYASKRLAHRLQRCSLLRRARRLALYLPSSHEIDPTHLLGTLHRRGVEVYVPVLRPGTTPQLWFVRLTPETPLIVNRFGLLEPAARYATCPRHRCPAWALDLVIVPLVGFDAQGGRMGMGGGYYDRTFAFTRHGGKRPTLLGVAFEHQRVTVLPLAPWDVPLDAIVTDQHVYENARATTR